ncbi:MAG: alpha/beta fold hydrolase, partial [Dehalococcoidales bacterium]|nr:alpha/beta fold hydrolase [Dehalococcoidales bacterium]
MADKPYAEELVYAETEDGLILEGVVISPASKPAQSVPIVWIHGLAGKFYSPLVVKAGRELAAAGHTVIAGNNRGHDFGTTLLQTNGRVKLGGGGWERFEESPLDVAAWLDFATSLGFKRAVLLGHSLGSLKVTYYQAQRQDERVHGLITASPPVRAGRVRPELLATAQEMVAAGRSQDLLPWGISPVGGGTFSARAYLNRAQVNLDVFGVDTANPAVCQIR